MLVMSGACGNRWLQMCDERRDVKRVVDWASLVKRETKAEGLGTQLVSGREHFLPSEIPGKVTGMKDVEDLLECSLGGCQFQDGNYGINTRAM